LGTAFEDDPRWLLVQRIVASPGFVNSNRLSTFLLYVSRQALEGEGSGLNERSIGQAVFERSRNYDPRDDNIVRSHASRLRTRLEEYFATEGAGESLRVTIPRGSYAPQFEIVDSLQQEAAVEPTDSAAEFSILDAPTLPALKGKRLNLSNPLIVAFAAFALVIAAVSWVVYPRLRSTLEHTPTQKLWSQMFRDNQETLVVPADSSLVIGRLIDGHAVTLAEYAGGAYRQAPKCEKPCDPATVQTVENLRYTSMTALEFAVTIARLPEAIPNRMEIRFARDLQLKDFKESNLILIGSEEADPWLSVIEGQMNFVVHDHASLGPQRLENRRPQAGELSEYLYDVQDPQRRSWATIAFLPNLSGNGNILVVQGFSTGGTQAAAEFVTNGKELDALLRSYASGSAKLPHFEILLSTTEVNGMASRPVPLAVRIYP